MVFTHGKASSTGLQTHPALDLSKKKPSTLLSHGCSPGAKCISHVLQTRHLGKLGFRGVLWFYFLWTTSITEQPDDCRNILSTANHQAIKSPEKPGVQLNLYLVAYM